MTATNIKCSGCANRPRTLLLAAVMVLLPAAGRAAPRDQVKAGVARCDGIRDDRMWLDCFYGAAEPMRAHLGLKPAPEFQTRLVPPPGPDAAPAATASAPSPSGPSGGGLSGIFGGSDVEARQHMTDYRFDRAGLFTVTLADGSVWRQLPSDGILADWRGAANGYLVTISRGAFGSRSLTIVGSGTRFSVKRIR